jgi:hypothetical protein
VENRFQKFGSGWKIVAALLLLVTSNALGRFLTGLIFLGLLFAGVTWRNLGPLSHFLVALIGVAFAISVVASVTYVLARHR